MNTKTSPRPRRRGNTAWAMVLSWLSTLLLAVLAVGLVLLTTVCSASFMKKQVNRSAFSEAAYSFLYDNFVSYGAASGFSADVMTSALSREQITADMEESVTWMYEGDTAQDTRNGILNTTYDNMIADLKARGVEVTPEIESAVVVVADACRQDYANYVTVPLASQLYTLIEKLNRIVPVVVCLSAVLCAVSLYLTIRLAGTPRFGVRCLTYLFTAAAVLCIIAATALVPAMHLNNLNLSPASVKQLIITYVENLFGRFGLFALLYGVVAVILLALTLTAKSRSTRRKTI